MVGDQFIPARNNPGAGAESEREGKDGGKLPGRFKRKFKGN